MHYTSKEVYEFISKQTNDPIVERRICRVSGTKFPVFQSDKEFYDKISPIFGGRKYLIPFPTLCPEERMRRRLLFRNERKLYRRKCDFSGKEIVSIYSPDSLYTVYDSEIWRSDKWDAMDYGIKFDRNKNFSEQFGMLLKKFPRLGIRMREDMENCHYCNNGNNSKNCYMCNTAIHSENCYYSHTSIQCSYDIEGYYNVGNQYCYYAVQSENNYNCMFLFYSKNCKNCSFLDDCDNCEFCFGCVNLKNKKFCYFNKQLTEKDYNQKVKNININDFQDKFRAFSKTQPKSFMRGVNFTNSFGDFLVDCENCHNCYGVLQMKDSKYCWAAGLGSEDVYDSLHAGPLQKSYECVTIDNASYNIAVLEIAICHHVYYSQACSYCNDCFACVGLKNKQYCIFNEQYSKEEYNQLVPQIIEQMIKEGMRGEFFSPSLSPFGYNETVAQEYFPLTREEALARGYKRQDKEYPINVPEGMKTIDAKDLPSDIMQVDDSILNKAIICEVSGKPFRIIKSELAFYRKHNLSLPRKHPDIRHTERLAKRPGRSLYLRTCDKCGKEMLSVYMKSDEEKGSQMKKNEIRLRKQRVYCEECYRKEVYG